MLTLTEREMTELRDLRGRVEATSTEAVELLNRMHGLRMALLKTHETLNSLWAAIAERNAANEGGR